MPSKQSGFVTLNHKSLKMLMKRIARSKSDAYYRQGNFSTDIIWDGRRFVFPNPKKSATENMWIFRNVMNEVKDFTNYHNIREKPKLPVNYWHPKNRNYRGKITATDLDHAYWRIAFLNEYISVKTYLKGLELKDKTLRLASLANLSSSKEYFLIKDGVMTEKLVVMKYDPILHKVYSNIRYECYQHMMNVAELLGNDFICYKTDCIYYKDKPENRKLVQDYMDENLMEWKQLIEPEKPSKKDDEPEF